MKHNDTPITDSNPRRRTWSELMVTVGLLAIMVAACLPLLKVRGDLFRYIYAAGALILLGGRFVAPPVAKDASLRLRRLLRVEIWSALIFVAGAVFMFVPSAGWSDWIAFTLAGGLLTIYTSVMIPRQKLKE